MKAKKAAAALLICAVAGSFAMSGCGRIDADAAVVTIDGDIVISAGYANFAARMTQAQYDMYLSSYYGEGYWTSDSYTNDDGQTMEESVKDSVLEDLELYYILESHMDDYDVEITEDEQSAITEAAEQFLSDNTDDTIKAVGATQEYVEKYLYLQTVTSKMEDAIKAGADTEVSDEEAAQRTFSYVSIDMSTSYTDDDGNTVDYTEDEMAQKKSDAEAFASEAASDFDAAAESYGYSSYTYSYGSDEESEEDGGFNADVISAADAMSAGEVSDLIEGDDCYYVIRLDSEYDEEATASKKESIISERQSDLYNEVTQGWLDDADIDVDNAEWKKVKFDNLFSTVTTTDDTDDTSADAE